MPPFRKKEKKTDRQFKWENIRVSLARGIAFTRARASSVGLAGTTLESAIAEAIIDVDSAQSDTLLSLGESNVYVEVEIGISSGQGKGKLQKIEDLITLYYGDGDVVGLFDQFREIADPEV